MVTKNRLKLLLWLGLSAATAIALVATIAALGRIVVFFNSGADRASALNIVPAVPPDLGERVTWLPDHPDAAEGRLLDPVTRDRIAGAYIEGWAQINISHELGRPYGLKTYFSGQALEQVTGGVEDAAAQQWQHLQSNLHHLLQLTFFSDDGSVVALTDHNAEFVRYLRQPEAEAGRVIESNSAYDVVMLLEDGNWRVRFLVRRGDAREPDLRLLPSAPLTETAAVTATLPLTPALPTTADRSAPVVRYTLRGKTLYRDGLPYTIRGVNYYPRATPWTLFWPEYDPRRTAFDLGLVKRLGQNAVRIFVPFEEFGGGKELNEEYFSSLLDFLDQADNEDVGVVLTIFDHRTDHRPVNWAADKRHLSQLVPRLADHPAILMWDVKNEPDRDYGFNSPELTQAWLRYVIREIRRHDPNHLITIGWSNPESAAALADVVDIVSYHYFDAAEDYLPRVYPLIRAAGDTPIFLQEIALPTWNSIWPHGHTEAEQAVYFANLLQQHGTLDSVGYMFWTVYDFTTVPLAEFSTPWKRAQQANMGLVRTDYTLKPVADVVMPGASLDLPPIPAWRRFTKPFWLMVFGCVGMLGLFLVLVLYLVRRRRLSPLP